MRFFISLMRAWYGDAATKENEWGFQWLPRVTGDHSEQGYWLDMADGKMEGLFVMGQNPAVGATNGRLQRKAMSKLKWLVVRDLIETETASFWKDSPEVERGELDPAEIATEVFLMPAAGSVEKSGTFTNTQRLLQWHNQAVEPPGDARSEAWFVYYLGRLLKEKAARERTGRNAAINALTWDLPTEGEVAEPKAEAILAEINGWQCKDRSLLPTFDDLRADGSTASGCWIYTGVMPRPDLNRANQREPKDKLGHGWGFSWPKDIRVLYNRASARPNGEPWSEAKKFVWWDKQKREWTGKDISDFKKDIPPDHKGDVSAGGLGGARWRQKPFVLHSDGRGWLYVSSGLKDGPLPAHFEPLESLIRNPVYPEQQVNPAADTKQRPDNPYADSPDDPRFPYILTTYRLTEHHTAGGMSRGLSHLAELQPRAVRRNLTRTRHRTWPLRRTTGSRLSPRAGIVSAKALITARIRPLDIDGRTVHQVGLPYHWGWKGIVTGDVVNDLLAISQEPNVRIMESKALLCNLVPGRRREGKDALTQWTQLLKEKA